MNIRYLLPRVIRHFLPASTTRLLLSRGWIIRPGMETRAPLEAAQRYQAVLAQVGVMLPGKRVLVFGYGGNFTVACALLRMGAQHMVLCEKDAKPDHERNAALLPDYPDYLKTEQGRVVPRPEYITLAEGDIRLLAEEKAIQPVDLVLSNSVYEHLGDVDGITGALASLTSTDGVHLHYIDLRDHFFKYPFEMLTYSEKTWNGWLNPTSNHNRFRCRNYQEVFARYFQAVELEVLARDEEAFRRAQTRIRPEFLTGNESDDAVTLVKVLARQPK